MPSWEEGAGRGPSGQARSVNADKAAEEDGRSSGCFDSMSCTRDKSKMVFAGTGQGEYEKVTDHVYVGEKSGAWRKEEIVIPYGWRLRKCSICCIAVFTLLCITGICLCVASLASRGGDEVPGSYDCDLDADDWERSWGDRHKDWCCLKSGRGCPTTKMPDQFNCEVKRSTWQTAWSDAKKDWCCGFTREKCTEESDDDFDCGAGLVNWREGWSADKKAWCCEHFGRGCLSPAYDCSIGLDKWRNSWSKDKKAWCCEKSDQFCVDDADDSEEKQEGKNSSDVQEAHNGQEAETAAKPKEATFDCAEGLSRWEKGWSDEKKAWCCEHKKVHCSHDAKYKGCKSVCVYKGWAAICINRIKWSIEHEAPEAHKSKCEWAHDKVMQECSQDCSTCDLAAAGCEAADSASDPYDCSVGESTWKDTWSIGKQAWCCLMHQKGCAGDGENHFECGDGVVRDWPKPKKQWCCEHTPELVGCEDLTEQLFKCDDSKKAQWSTAEQLWCCAKTGKGCDGVTADPYDCDAGFATWWTWSASKTKYCCEEKGKTCKTPDCDADFDAWQSKWSKEKKEWCCHQMGRGCAGEDSVDSDELDAAQG